MESMHNRCNGGLLQGVHARDTLHVVICQFPKTKEELYICHIASVLREARCSVGQSAVV